jgi:2,4-dienoyl-CoA reductase-like NADH-dependent reductase (Old Yellow Enzyme family)
MAFRRTRAVTEAEIARILGEFASAARIVEAGGFDAIELHLGHGYLASEFLSPKLNRRTDRWGGRSSCLLAARCGAARRRGARSR